MNNFEVRDMRNGDWSWVYNKLIADPHLTAADKLAYMALATFAGMKEIRPSYEQIASRCNLGKRTVVRAIANVVRAGYVSIERGGGRTMANEYWLLKRIKGCQKCTVSQNGANGDTKTVPTATINGATLALHKDNKKDKDKDISAEVSAKWTNKELLNYLEDQLLSSKDPAIRVIGIFLAWHEPAAEDGAHHAKMMIRNLAQMRGIIKRYIRAARELVSMYGEERIEEVLGILKEHANFKVELETIGKYIHYTNEEIINQLTKGRERIKTR